MAEISKSLGLGSIFEYQGKTYTCSPWTFKIQGEFERYLEEHAIQKVKLMKPSLNEEEYRSLVSSVHKDIASGAYSFGGEAVSKSISTMVHFRVLLLLCLRVNHKEITMTIVDDLVKERLEEMMAKVSEANSDPNIESLDSTTTV